jgi:hypothetical protein
MKAIKRGEFRRTNIYKNNAFIFKKKMLYCGFCLNELRSTSDLLESCSIDLRLDWTQEMHYFDMMKLAVEL